MEEKQALEEIRSSIVAQGNTGQYRNNEGKIHIMNDDDKSRTAAAASRGGRKDERSTKWPPNQFTSTRQPPNDDLVHMRQIWDLFHVHPIIRNFIKSTTNYTGASSI